MIDTKYFSLKSVNFLFQGCFYHGCPLCFNPDVLNPVLGVKMSKLAEKTRTLTEQLRSAGYDVVEKWEHDFLKEKKSDLQLQEFLKDHEIQDRLNPRDSFYGGRTNAIKLCHEGPAKYIDFTSLYPWCNKYAQ